MDAGWRPTPAKEAWDLLKEDRGIKGNFEEGNVDSINALREKSRYEGRAKLGLQVCVQEGTPSNSLYSFEAFETEYHEELGSEACNRKLKVTVP